MTQEFPAGVLPGSSLVIDGEFPPCPTCKAAMNGVHRALYVAQHGPLEGWVESETPPFVDQWLSTNVRIGFVRDEDENFAALVLCDRTGHTIEIQRSIEFDAQDKSGRMNTYCLVHGVAIALYGGLDSYFLSDHTLRLQLRADAAAALKLPERLTFPVDPAYVPTLQLYLHEVLNDKERGWFNRLWNRRKK